MKSYFIALIFSILSTVVSADTRLKNIYDECVIAYKTTDSLLQFLYKFDGNLPNIKSTKLKHLEFLISNFNDGEASTSSRKKAFDELFNDPDYYQFRMQEKSSKLIKELEELKSKSSPEKDRDLIFSLPKIFGFATYQNPYKKIEKLVQIQYDVGDFFEELENGKVKLEQLNQIDRLKKSLDNNPQSLAFTIGLYKKLSITRIISCNLDYLEAERLSR
jgi:hypothetical protein